MAISNALYRAQDALRMAKQLVGNRLKVDGESIPCPSDLKALPANVLVSFASRPASMRAVKLQSVASDCVVLRYSCGR